MEKASGHPSKPRRPASHAKRHFESIKESRLTKWKCKYCAMTYGEKTATSNLWRHLENKHRQNIGINDQRQSMANRKCDSDPVDTDQWSSIDGCSSSKRFNLEQHRWHFQNNHPQIRMALQRDDLISSVGYRYAPLPTWVPNPCSTPKSCNHRLLCESDTGQSLTTAHRIHAAIHRILSSSPDFVDFFNDLQVTQLMRSMTPDFHDAILVNVVKALVTSKERQIIGQLKKHEGGLHLNLEMIKITPNVNVGANRSKMAVQVVYEDLSDRYGPMTSPGDDDDDDLLSGSKVTTRRCPLVFLGIDPEASAHECCTRILEILEKFQVKNRLLTVIIGQCRFMDTLVRELQSMLRDIGIYAISSYATVDSIRDGLFKNLQEFREHAEDIRNVVEEILNFSKDFQNSVVSKASKCPRMDKMAATVKSEVDKERHSTKMVTKIQQEVHPYKMASKADQEGHSNKMVTKTVQEVHSTKMTAKEDPSNEMAAKVDQEDHPNDLLLRALRWDLMPILPHIRSLEDFLSEARALGVAYNFNSGCDWKRLSLVLQEVRSNLKDGIQCSIEEDHRKLLRTLLKKLSVFPESLERAISFLHTTDLSSPLTQHIINATKHLPETMDEEHLNNTLLLKMWTTFINDES